MKVFATMNIVLSIVAFLCGRLIIHGQNEVMEQHLVYDVKQTTHHGDNKHFKVNGIDLTCTQPHIEEITLDERNLTNIYLLMTINEKVMLLRKIRQAKFYFEYGCGGSTILACRCGSNQLKMVSVDSSKEWLSKVQNDSCFAEANGGAQFKLHHANIGPVAGFGYPIDSTTASKWPSYSNSINLFTPREVDLVLVDGRFRVASALQAMLSTKPGTDILFHDFFSRRQYYPVLRYADIVDCADTLVVLRRKPSARDEDIAQLLHKFNKNTF